MNIIHKFKYDGPVYKYDTYVEDVHLETEAATFDKAIQNFKHQLKELYKSSSYIYNIDETLIEPDGYSQETLNQFYKLMYDDEAPQYCSKCGTPLTDGGYCPICDDGEEDY